MARHAPFPQAFHAASHRLASLCDGRPAGYGAAALQCRHGGAYARLHRVWPGWRRASLRRALEHRAHQRGTSSAALPPWPWRSPYRQRPVTPGPRVRAPSLEPGHPGHGTPGCHRQRHATCPSRAISGSGLPIDPTIQSLSRPLSPPDVFRRRREGRKTVPRPRIDPGDFRSDHCACEDVSRPPPPCSVPRS